MNCTCGGRHTNVDGNEGQRGHAVGCPAAQEAPIDLTQRRREQLEREADDHPPEAWREAMRLAHEQQQQLEEALATQRAETEHFKSETFKLGRVLAYLIEKDHDGELWVDLDDYEARLAARGNAVMLDFVVHARTLMIRLEQPPGPSREVQSG